MLEDRDGPALSLRQGASRDVAVWDGRRAAEAEHESKLTIKTWKRWHHAQERAE